MNEHSSEELISVVIPAFNAGRYIARTLEAVLQQTHQNLEIIVVDDGSTDDTSAEVQRLAAVDQRIVLIRTERHGVSHARNVAIARASAEYIAPIDADDVWKPEKLRRQFALFNGAPVETGVVYCGAAGIDDDDRVVLPVWNNRYESGDVLHALIETGLLSCGSTPLIRKRYIEQVGGYDEELHLAEDWKFYTALAGVCRFAVIPECLTGYRIRNDSSSVQLEPMRDALARCTAWIRATWPDIPARVMRERDFTIQTYLAFMAIRAGKYSSVPAYLARAASIKPREIVGLSIWQFAFLLVARAAGYRRFAWSFWRAPEPFFR